MGDAVTPEQLAWIAAEVAAHSPAPAPPPPQKSGVPTGEGPDSSEPTLETEEHPGGGGAGGADISGSHLSSLADFLLGANAGGQPLSADHYGCMAAYCQVCPAHRITRVSPLTQVWCTGHSTIDSCAELGCRCFAFVDIVSLSVVPPPIRFPTIGEGSLEGRLETDLREKPHAHSPHMNTYCGPYARPVLTSIRSTIALLSTRDWTVAEMSAWGGTGRGNIGGAAGRGDAAHHGARGGPGVQSAGGAR